MPLACTVREIKASNLHLPMLKAESSLRMRRATWPVGRGSKITAYLEFPKPHCLFTVRLRWRLRVVCRASRLLSIFSCNFSKSENGPKISGFGEIYGGNMKDECWDPPGNHSPYRNTSSSAKNAAILPKMCSQSLARKEKNNPVERYISPLCPADPACWADLYHFWHAGSDHRHDHPSQILSRLIQGFGGYGCPKSGVSHWLILALTTVLRTTVLHCDKLFGR